nr:MAG TPA: hypothetical protein [Bacteriophage sp.]
MKRLVFALRAQRRVNAGFEEFVGDRNGIRQPTHLFVETYSCGKIFMILFTT